MIHAWNRTGPHVARPPSGRATVRQIAVASGYSVGTVSRALSGHPAVAPSTRDAVLAAAASLGVAVDAARSGGELARSRAADGLVLVRCPYVLDDYFGRVVTAVVETLALHGRRVQLDSGESARGRRTFDELATDPSVAGAILVLPPEHPREISALRAAGFPLVVVDPMTTLPGDVPSVSAAHLTSARALTSHLLELGHRRIGVVGGPPGWVASRSRLAGHASALADAGLLPDPSLRRSIRPTAEEGHRAAAELLDLPEPPTAVVAFNDKAASGVLSAAAERGLRVPGDLSVTGFDDLDLARSTVPALTTARQPLEEMGRMAVSLLLRLITRQAVDALHVSLATELVVRGSTAAPLA
jgi:LacI family transcriptional regulator